MDSAFVGREIRLKEISRLYEETAGDWLLLEILETNATGTPIRLRVLAQSSDKDELHELMMEQDDWDWSKRYLIVYSDPSRPCEIG
ncbi:MAG: hypothetical protein Q9P14_06370 [candidate division KSB1 bacterium]|nr:hypothetical protein [candidate division KSB1 bacterium]MDQ7063360.1 hypothetical protein [candidate division KSB1 bacterium]